jgi:hypothetical protein
MLKPTKFISMQLNSAPGISANLELIIEFIKSEKCTLFLGPELFGEGNKPHFHPLMEYLKTENQGSNILAYYENENLFLFPSEAEKNETFFRIKAFYRNYNDTGIFDDLSVIPFHLIITLNPDMILSKVFKKKGIPFDFHSFRKSGNNDEIMNPSIKRPLIYNLMGSVESMESMILTHDDMFDYLVAVLGQSGLPTGLRKLLRESKLFLFLGFNFDQWYIQLLLRLLHPPEIRKKPIRYAFDPASDGQYKTFFLEQFNMKFLDIPPADFIRKLAAECSLRSVTRDEAFRFQIHLSYARSTDEKTPPEEMQFIDQLYLSLKQGGYQVVLDKIDLEYMGEIRAFMDMFGKGRCSVVVISDKYLTSEYCMYELLQVWKNQGFNNRFFPVLLGETDIFSVRQQMTYYSSWEQKLNEIDTEINKRDKNSIPRFFLDKREYIYEIKENYMKMLSFILSRNLLTPKEHLDCNFREIKKNIDKLQQQDEGNL